MAQFAIENLTFSYPTEPEHPSLQEVTLQVEQGEYIALCGKSGSGKTTLLRHLKTVLTPHGNRTGSIFYEGAPLDQADLRKQSSEIGFVMQNPDSQIVTDKVWHELAFGLESLGCDQKTMRLRVAEMASYFGIQSWFHRDVAELSGGQKQLLNLASIMAMQPRVLILDEPTSQLDPIAASDFLNTVKKSTGSWAPRCSSPSTDWRTSSTPPTAAWLWKTAAFWPTMIPKRWGSFSTPKRAICSPLCLPRCAFSTVQASRAPLLP